MHKKGLVEKPLKSPKAGPTVAGRGIAAPKNPREFRSQTVLSPEEVAERLGVGLGVVDAWLEEGLLKGSSQGVQLYEVQKFRADHPKSLRQAQQGLLSAPSRSGGTTLPPRAPRSLWQTLVAMVRRGLRI